MNKIVKINNIDGCQVIDPQKICTMCDDRCCGHCKHYDGEGYCCDGTAVTSYHWCGDFEWGE